MYTGEVKVRFHDYSTGIWEDWSQWVILPPATSEKVESKSKGLPGVIAYDSAKLTLRYHKGIRPYEVFSADLSSDIRFVFEISIPDDTGTQYQRLQGIADISTIETPAYQKEISFEIVDRLSAINKLVTQNIREDGTIFGNVYGGTGDRINYAKYWDTDAITMRYTRSDSLVINTLESDAPDIGDIIEIDFLNNGESNLPDHLGLITFKYFDSQFINGRVFLGIHSENSDYYEATTDQDHTGTCDEKIRTDTTWYSSLFYNQDIYLKRYRDNDYPLRRYTTQSIIETIYVSGWEIYAFDGIKLIEAIVKQQWNNITVVNRIGADNFPVPLSFFTQLIGEHPFDEHPFDALVKLADTMQCYIMLNEANELIIQNKKDISTVAGTERTIGNTRIYDQDPKYFWDKLVDGVEVTVKSWLKDSNGDEISGFYALYKGAIKPKNILKKTILCDDPTITDVNGLNAVAYTQAQVLMDFYGKRHKSNTLTLNYDSNTSQWKLTDWVVIDNEKYFIVAIDLDNATKKMEIEIVSVIGYAYDLRAVNISKSSNIFSSGGISTIINQNNSGDGTHPNQAILDAITAAFTTELKDTYDNAVSLSHLHNNLALLESYTNTNADITDAIQKKHTHLNINNLNVINQDLSTNDTPTFSQILLNSPTIGNNAVIASRTLQITTNSPLTINNSNARNLLSNLSWELALTTGTISGTSNQVNVTGTGKSVVGDLTLSTPQDIATNSTPEFAGLKIGVTNAPFDVSLKDNFELGNTGFSGNNTSIFSGTGMKMYGADGEYSLIIDNLTIRNKMNIYELILNQIRATNGSLMVSSACKIVYAEFYSGYDAEQTYLFETVNDAYHGFKSGDLIRCRRANFEATVNSGNVQGEYSQVTVHDIKMQVLWISSLKRFSAKTIELPNIDNWQTNDEGLTEEQKQINVNILKGKEFVRIGHISDTTRQGLIYLTSDDNDSPFIDILDGLNTHEAYREFNNTKVRIGKLEGLTDNDLGTMNGYGIYANNAYLKGGVVASFGKIAGHNITGTGIVKTTDYNQIEMNSVGLYFLAGRGQDIFGQGHFVLMGKIPAGLTGAGQMGIINHSSAEGKTYFVLSETEHQIANWNFDHQKLWNGQARIESSDTLKGLAVKNSSNEDVLKVGDFINTESSYETSAFAIPAGWTVDSTSHPGSYDVTENIFVPTASTGYQQFMVKVSKTLDVISLKGKTVRVDFEISEEENSKGDGLIKVFAVLETNLGELGLVEVTPDIVFTPTVWKPSSVVANIPLEATYLKLKLIIAYNQSDAMATIAFQNFSGAYYNKTVTELNNNGLKINASPLNKIELSNSGGEVLIPEVKVSSMNIEGFRFAPSTYLSGDGETIKSRLELRYNNTTITYWDA